MPGIFAKIIAGEIPSYKVAENEYCYAFLDINPLKEGHTLVVPKRELDYLYDLDDETYLQLMVFSKKVALAIQKVVSCKRICSLVLGFEVPHAHIHLIPTDNEAEVSFSNPRKKYTAEEFKATSQKIAQSFGELSS